MKFELWGAHASHSMASHIVHISGLKPDFDPQELLYSLDLGVNIEEVIRHVEAHGNGAVFLVFADDRSADRCIQRYHGKVLLDSSIQVSRPTPALLEQLRKMNPSIVEHQPQLQMQKNEPVDDATAVSAVLKAISHLSGSQRELLRKALEPQSTSTPVDPGLGMANGKTVHPSLQGIGATTPYPPSSTSTDIKLGAGVLHHPLVSTSAAVGVGSAKVSSAQSHPYGYGPNPLLQAVVNPPFSSSGVHPPLHTSTPSPAVNPSFHFGHPSTAHSVRVSTFSGSPNDCSFEQFRYDVQCLINQGAAEGVILLAIKRSIKGQAQEIALHMGETATVADILKRFEMMFGDVNPPHVLLAQFYAAEQHPGESVTDWYARIEDIASKIIRKDSTVISPNNYDVIVNTQFWTKMQDDRIKSALRHKFNMLSGSPQFIIEARKIESECKMETVRVQQAHIEVSPTIQEGLDSLLSRLVSLEDKLDKTTATVEGLQKGYHPPAVGPAADEGSQRRKTIRCFHCKKLGHIKRNCPDLNSVGSAVRSAPTPQ